MSTILVIDDNRDFLDDLAFMLRLRAYNVVTTHDPLYSLELIQQNPPDLIICDFSMPRLNGEFLRRRLHQDKSTSDIPFIFMSGSFHESIVPSVIQLLKPVPINELLSAIQNTLIA
jgi:CRP/FNR family cyclic AMP-dependent transcriptional regulator